MAGAPSRGGSQATTIGMVVSIVVAVILAGVLIWLYTMQEELRATAQSANDQRDRIVRGAEENTLKAMFAGGPSGGTLAGSAINGSKNLIAELTGDNTMTADAAVASFESAIAEIRTAEKVPDPTAYTNSAGATAIVKRLHEDYIEKLSQFKDTQDALDKANKELESARQAHDELVKKVDDFMKKVDAQVQEVQVAKSNYEDEKNSEVAATTQKIAQIRQDYNDFREQSQTMKKEFQTAYAETRNLLDQQQKVIKEFKGPEPAEARELASARKPIGVVLRTLPGNSLLYINLGRNDGVSLGMPFAVYSANEAIPANGRGKASIEVVSVDKGTSECRIVSPPSPDDPILEGDGINNILLARTRGKQHTFVVVGDFDVDFDGTPDPRGRESIIRLIEREGGRVVDEVTPLTDFLVVGAEPRGQDVLAGLGKAPVIADATAPAMAKTTEEEKTSDEKDADEDEDADEKEASNDNENDNGDDWGGGWDDDDKKGDDKKAKDSDDENDNGDDESGDNENDNDDDWGKRFDGGDGGNGAMQTIRRTPEVDPTVPTLKRRYRSEAERYRDSLWRAQNFSVPVLTQEQFFNFVGIEGTRADIRRLQG
ncbi:MAG: hypothetical protein H6819_05320 [Phycisphaerales bacterium]|nr:hypothetical protein [Phycisphaerales bacterium]MCB9854801.1 hypothetical protein [Phycisphaerales bacterium]MCB9863727.1 hypothetical protein [Phycisphaerales bacterium]